MNNFHVGQVVICVDDTSRSGKGVKVTKNKLYVIQGIKHRNCCNTLVLNVGLTTKSHTSTCICGSKHLIKDNVSWSNISRFIPLETDNIKSVLNELVTIENEI